MLKRYLANSSGNIAIITALTMGLIIMGAGVAIDYSGSTSEYARMQTALDSAVLAAATDVDSQNKDVKAIIEKTVRQNFAPSKPGDVESLDVEVTVDADDIKATLSMDYSTSVMGIFGRPTMPLEVRSGGPRGNIPAINIALVVDTTESMDGTNMADLQVAAGELIDALKDSGADVRMALVPYGQYVNVGMGAQNADWVDASETWTKTDESWHEFPEMTGGTPPKCIRSGPPKPIYESRDGILVDTGETTDSCAEWQDGTDGTQTGVTSRTPIYGYEAEYVFNGCMGSRTAPDNMRPDAGPGDRIPAAMFMERERSYHPDGTISDWYDPQPDDFRMTECGQRITPLTTKLETVRTRVNALTTNGQTYLPSGLIWGWRVLDPSVPYTQAANGAKRRNAKSVMIFMTDGENSAFKSGKYHKPAGTSESNSKSGLNDAALLCQNIKDSQIDIYTVAYNLQGGVLEGQTAGMLSACASSTTYAYTPDNRAELIENFKMITDSLAEVRLDY